MYKCEKQKNETYNFGEVSIAKRNDTLYSKRKVFRECCEIFLTRKIMYC